MGSAFLNSLHAHLRSGTKGASAIDPQLKEIWSSLFIKRLWASQTSNNIFYKTKVVPFEILINKVLKKLKLDNFWPSDDPSNDFFFFIFPVLLICH
jgi:hypothetical protein